MSIIFCAVTLHCCNDIFGSLNYWICSEASGLGDLTGSPGLEGWVGGHTEEGFKACSPNDGGGVKG